MERSVHEYGRGVFNMDGEDIKKIGQNSIFELPTLGTLQNKEGKSSLITRIIWQLKFRSDGISVSTLVAEKLRNATQ